MSTDSETIEETNPAPSGTEIIRKGIAYNSHHKEFTFIIMGASGDLAQRKVYPTLWFLFKESMIPPLTDFIGYARSKITVKDIRLKTEKGFKFKQNEQSKLIRFWELNHYVSGDYDNDDDFKRLDALIKKTEENCSKANRIFYLALPANTYDPVTRMIKKHCFTNLWIGHNRIVIEKPFGRDLQSSRILALKLSKSFSEDELYRIDHYLGKEMVQNLLALRFANHIFAPTWNRHNIASVSITFKETIGTFGRGGYFDSFGIIRDVMQNHLIQILCLVAMEKPFSINAEDIRNEKVRVLKFVQPVKLEDTVLGQYVGNPNGKTPESRRGYREETKVDPKSNQCTFAFCVLKINNERWEGVPFFLKCGKSLDQQKAEVRIQYKDTVSDIYHNKTKRNELVLRVQPKEAIYIKMMLKEPGLGFDLEETELDFTMQSRYKDIVLPDAYERLILDVFLGSQALFLRGDEVDEAWRIFTPLLHRMEKEQIEPLPYLIGSRGPVQAQQLCAKYGFKYSKTYKWKQPEQCVLKSQEYRQNDL